jgi:ABC-type polysaccharide/polyol phosphate transport system ATPase subunit
VSLYADAIVARSVGVEYDLRLTQRRTLRRALGENLHPRRQAGPSKFWALEDVTFAAQQGDAIGVIGQNGAGKSTLLLTIAGILKPDRGTMRTFGRVSTLLTLGAGFDPDMTGRENVFLNGAFLGFHRAKIEEVFPAIVEFSGLQAFIDVPLRKYSAGMRTRLAFAIASHVEPEVLLLDEVLGVGDEAFRARSSERIFELMEAANVIVLVSHDLAFVQRTCTKVLWLHEGRTAAFGEPAAVVAKYQAYAADPSPVLRAAAS